MTAAIGITKSPRKQTHQQDTTARWNQQAVAFVTRWCSASLLTAAILIVRMRVRMYCLIERGFECAG
jgi:hypothetical protein